MGQKEEGDLKEKKKGKKKSEKRERRRWLFSKPIKAYKEGLK